MVMDALMILRLYDLVLSPCGVVTDLNVGVIEFRLELGPCPPPAVTDLELLDVPLVDEAATVTSDVSTINVVYGDIPSSPKLKWPYSSGK